AMSAPRAGSSATAADDSASVCGDSTAGEDVGENDAAAVTRGAASGSGSGGSAESAGVTDASSTCATVDDSSPPDLNHRKAPIETTAAAAITQVPTGRSG